LSFDEPELLKIAGKSGLRDAHFLLRETAAEFFLADDGLAADQPQDLAVTKCFADAHDWNKYTTSCMFIQSFFSACK
jgi:hypothetical protein